jgi:hypothetical protein
MDHGTIAAMLRGALLATLLVGCHTRSRVTTTTPGEERPVIDEARSRAAAPTAVVTAAGMLRFVEPLRCAADVMVEVETVDEVTVKPNLATFVVGVVATVAGGIGLISGLANDNDVGAGLGGVGLAVGLPFAIGPWIGNGTTDVNGETTTIRKGATEVPCGERPVAARTARVEIAGLRAFGAVDADGVFAISPFSFVDAFAVGELPALDVKADLIGDAGTTTVQVVIDASAVTGAGAYLTAAGVDARVETLRKVPRVDVGTIAVARITIEAAPTLRVVVPIVNEGPGDVWQLRAVLSASHPEIDGRILYVGHVAPRSSVDAELVVPLSAAADGELAGKTMEIMVGLREAQGTVPEAPFRLKGKL